MDAVGGELDAQRVRHRLERVLRHRVRAEEGQRAAAGDGADDDDAAARVTHRRQERLRHGQLADDVHLQLVAQLLER